MGNVVRTKVHTFRKRQLRGSDDFSIDTKDPSSERIFKNDEDLRFLGTQLLNEMLYQWPDKSMSVCD